MRRYTCKSSSYASKQELIQNNAGMVKALENLSLINWDLYSAPWIHCLIIKNENDKWVIASEERSKRIDIILEVVLWLVGFLSLEDDEASEMKETYQTYLKCNEETQDSLWKEIEATYKKINGNIVLISLINFLFFIKSIHSFSKKLSDLSCCILD